MAQEAKKLFSSACRPTPLVLCNDTQDTAFVHPTIACCSSHHRLSSSVSSSTRTAQIFETCHELTLARNRHQRCRSQTQNCCTQTIKLAHQHQQPQTFPQLTVARLRRKSRKSNQMTHRQTIPSAETLLPKSSAIDCFCC